MTPRTLRRVLFALVLAVALPAAAALAQDCTASNTPPTDPGGQAHTLQPNLPMTVNIDPNFSSAQNAGIQAAFTNWQNSPVGQASGVTFSFTSSSTALPPASGNVQVNSGGASQGQAQTTPQSNGSRIVGAQMSTDPAMTDATAMTDAFAHELGHLFGLDDCPTCAAGSSVMTPAASPNDTTQGRTGPSPCDSETAQKVGGYTKGTGGGGGGPAPPCPKGHQALQDGGCNPSPIIVDVDGSGFHLTDAAHGVMFDIAATGTPVKIAWTAPGSTNAFLALDRNGNGRIDSGAELFGDHTAQPPSAAPNGFLALAEFDKPENGGNGDGIIDARDAVFAKLRLWQDTNHDGIAQAEELHTLAELGVEWIALDYHLSRREDRYGNQFRYRARIDDAAHSRGDRWTWDVFLVEGN